MKFDEVSGLVFIWRGEEQVDVVDTCGRMVDFWRYPRTPKPAAVLRDIDRRRAA